MSYQDVIGLLNTSMPALFCASMFVLWYHHRHLTYIGIFVLSYSIRALCFGIFYFAFALEDPVLRLMANVFLMLSMILLSIGLSSRRGQRPRYLTLLSIAGIALGALYYNQFVEQSLLLRVIYLNCGLAAVGLVMLLDAAKLPDRTPVEQVLIGLIMISCIGFLLRPLFLLASGNAEGGFEGAYWLVVSISDALISAMTAVGIFAVIASDVMERIKSDAQIDALSGLLNRRGFEARAVEALERQTTDARVSVIMSDLDHFKSINDRFGHSSGDRVIRAFSEVLRDKAPRDAIIARLGGEEFAIMLAARQTTAAPIFAEAARLAFKELAPRILSNELSPTASFGIAVAYKGEDLSALMERADRALYQAKNEGRDCIRQAGWTSS
ncbi:GGDEF domain-containing protein [Agrobacterium fabrum]|uniref:GGDEF domain-containing protein n=1 Tax=Agrobacterium fabrum TaxID=1176649 RepID=UPI000B81A2C4|nr:GGDEF domain-containing protein [Agrobacterium fabrum]